MFRYLLRLLPALVLFLVLPVGVRAQDSARDAKARAELQATVRRYDDALRRADVAAVEQFWAPEYIFVNPRGQRLTRADRLANLRGTRTAFDSLVHAPQEETIRFYGDSGTVAVYTTLLRIGGSYGGQAVQGDYRALVVWVRREGRWQQVASQLTPTVSTK
jgi:ketosteroid isomerase-like protein